MSRLRVGLTGGLASGKSTVARRMAELGCRVVDADRLVAELYAPGAAGAAAVESLFGPDLLEPSGAVDRAALGERVFSDPEARTRLEAAIHPLVRRRFEDLAAEAPDPIVVLEATLFVEAGYTDAFDYLVTVEADPETRVARAVARGLPEPEARARLAAQGDGSRRLAAADRVLPNKGTLEELLARTDDLVADLRKMAAHR